MWSDRPVDRPNIGAQPHIRFDESLWNDMVPKMHDAGVNLVVIDLGEAVQYESHPEISVKGAWSRPRLREELGRLRDTGIEPIPKLNFSTATRIRGLTFFADDRTDIYYEVCGDLIAEVSALFDKRVFSTLDTTKRLPDIQRHYLYAVMRQHELWWHDFESSGTPLKATVCVRGSCRVTRGIIRRSSLRRCRRACCSRIGITANVRRSDR